MAGLVEILRSSDEISGVYSLEEFVTLLAGELKLNRKGHLPGLAEYLSSAIVCTDTTYKWPEINSTEVRHTHSALVDSIISNLLRKVPTDNGLRLEESTQTLGYSRYTQTGALRKNPSLTISLKTFVWEAIHQYVGTEIIAHIVNGTNLFVFEQTGDAYVQIIGGNLAKYLKAKAPLPLVKRETVKNFRQYRTFLRTYSSYLQDLRIKKPDVLKKLPLINRTRMLYSPIIRKRTWLPAKHALNQKDPADSIVNAILGPNSSNKYRPTLLQFFQVFTRNYRKIKLGAHLNEHCPLPREFKGTFIDNMAAEYSFEWLFNQHCQWQEVCNFTITLLMKLLPRALLGFNPNKRAFQKSVILFLKMSIYEKVSCAALMEKLKLSEIKWIKEVADTSRRLMVGKIIHWLFNDFLVPILQNSFYITEKQTDSSLFYYRKPVWAIAQQKAMDRLKDSSFFSNITPLQATVCQDFTQFPPAKLRIQPKPTDFRPIMHFKSKIQVSANMKLSGNNLLAGVPQLLKNSISSDHEVFVLDYPAVINKLAQFSQEWEARGKPHLYFLSMDIAKAFDSVKLEHLREILSKIQFPLVSSYYKYIQLIPRYCRPTTGALAKLLKMKFKKLSLKEGDCPMFQDLPFAASTLNIPTSKTLINTNDRLQMIERILLGNVIKFNRQFFKGEKGIPQGLSCSPLLSNIYFSEFEDKAVHIVKQKHADTLFCATRLHDDYLLLSEAPEAIETFVTTLEELGNQFSFSFNREKIASNISADWVPNYQEQIEGWVGLNITSDLQVTPHISSKSSKVVAFDYTSARVTSTHLKNKLVKLFNISINLLKNRSNARWECLEQALARIMDLQAARYLLFLKTIQKFYGVQHSSRQIAKLIVGTSRASSQAFQDSSQFFEITLTAFKAAFAHTSLHRVSTRLQHYLEKLQPNQ